MNRMWNRCSLIEKILVTLSCLVFVSAITFLIYFESLFAKKRIHPDDKIAEVVRADKQVRRRMPMSFEFDKIKEGDIIGNGDSIYSGDNSKIMLKFLKGSQLVIGEQSLVVLREFNGKVDMKIEKGGVSGSIGESEEIEIKANQESVTINGEKDAQFSVSYKPGIGMEVISFDKNINVKYRGDQVALKDKKALINSKKGIQTSRNSYTDGRARDPANKLEDEKPTLPEGVNIGLEKNHEPITYQAPFPPNKQVFLHSRGGQIPIFPKEQCIDNCTIEIGFDNKPVVKQDFSKNSVPILFLKIETNVQAEVSWTFRDGPEYTSGKFNVWIQNEENFAKALKNQMQIEVMN